MRRKLHQLYLQWITIDARQGRHPICFIDLVFCSGLLIVAILLPVITGRGQIGIHTLSYLYSSQALEIADGRGLGGYYWPPGYPLLITVLTETGISPLRSAWIFSILSYAFSAVLIYLLCLRWTGRRLAFFASIVFCLSPISLKWANIAMPEFLFVATTLLAIVAFDFFFPPSRQKFSLIGSIIVGGLMAVPFWIRYVGISSIFVPLMIGGVYFYLMPQSRKALLICFVVLVSGLFVIFMRNFIGTGTFSGHPIGALPADTFFSALSSMGWYLGVNMVPPLKSFFSQAHHFLAGLMAFAIVLLAVFGLLKPRYSAVFIYPFIYLLLFLWSASHTRIDVVSERFVLPVMPCLWIALCEVGRCLGANIGSGFRLKIVRFVMILVCCINMGYGVSLVLKGCWLPDCNYSPETIAYLQKNVPDQSSIVVNRFGSQLTSCSLEYQIIKIPFDDPFNAGYTKAYGMKSWCRKDAIRLFLERNVDMLVFFMGKMNRDPFLEANAYGAYISQLVKGKAPEVQKIEMLKDGIIVHLVDRRKLASTLAAIETQSSLVPP